MARSVYYFDENNFIIGVLGTSSYGKWKRYVYPLSSPKFDTFTLDTYETIAHHDQSPPAWIHTIYTSGFPHIIVIQSNIININLPMQYTCTQENIIIFMTLKDQHGRNMCKWERDTERISSLPL